MAFSLTALSIALGVVDGLALVLVLIRLVFRLHIQRFWWEDAWAAVALVLGTMFVAAEIITYRYADYVTVLIAGWMVSNSFTSTVWAVRMSLLYATIRIMSTSSILRKVSRAIAVTFFIVWAILIALKAWWCSAHTISLLTLGDERPVCILPTPIVLVEVSADFISDAILVALSLKLLWRVKLPRRQRRMILCLFSSSAIISACSIFQATSLLAKDEVVEYVAFPLELTSALIVCDLLVVVTYMYRVVSTTPNGQTQSESESSSEDDDFTTRLPPTLTTVDLNSVTTATQATHNNLTSSIDILSAPLSYCSSMA